MRVNQKNDVMKYIQPILLILIINIYFWFLGWKYVALVALLMWGIVELIRRKWCQGILGIVGMIGLFVCMFTYPGKLLDIARFYVLKPYYEKTVKSYDGMKGQVELSNSFLSGDKKMAIIDAGSDEFYFFYLESNDFYGLAYFPEGIKCYENFYYYKPIDDKWMLIGATNVYDEMEYTK